jgi:hypothetical protein
MDLSSNKANGAVSYFIDHYVSTRVSRYTYGIEIYVRYDRTRKDHLQRTGRMFVTPAGKTCINGQFDVILPKVTYFECCCFHNFGSNFLILFFCRTLRFLNRKNSGRHTTSTIRKYSTLPKGSLNQFYAIRALLILPNGSTRIKVVIGSTCPQLADSDCWS